MWYLVVSHFDGWQKGGPWNQDCLQDLGIPLEKIYQAMEPLTAKHATTDAWRNAARPNCKLFEQAAAAQRDADAELAESSPVSARAATNQEKSGARVTVRFTSHSKDRDALLVDLDKFAHPQEHGWSSYQR